MNMYNIFHGYNPLAKYLARDVLQLTAEKLGRFRDAALYDKNTPGEYIIRVITRNGGSNRKHYKAINEGLTQHPLYLRDEDDIFDSTYAYFYFKLSDELRQEMKMLSSEQKAAIRSVVDNKSIKEKTEKFITSVKL